MYVIYYLTLSSSWDTWTWHGEFIKEMLGSRIGFDVYMFSILIHASCKEGKLEKDHRLFDDM